VARLIASRRSVLTRSPGLRGINDGATTTHSCRAAAGTGVETAVETVGGMAVGTVGGTAAAGVINVGFSGEHDFAAQDGILTRPFARLLSSSDVAS
jgi:hypothetical protein